MVYQWLEGKNVGIDEISNPIQAAKDLASFIIALQKIDTSNGPPALENKLRGASLQLRDTNTLKAISDMRAMINADLAIEIWKNALRAPEWDGDPVWFHGDLLPGNLIFEKGQLKAVIDFGGLGVGDPACDLMIAWGLWEWC
jgi:aminoglycoside phosphotransferase (APT) family kinase protein